MSEQRFLVALTADFFDANGLPKYRDMGLGLLEQHSCMAVRPFETHTAEIHPNQLAGVNGVVVLTPRVTAQSLLESNDLLAVGRFGVGYDSVDVTACTAADVALFITAGAVDHSVAEATVGWMLALSHWMKVKDRLVRDGAWDARSRYMGSELRNRILGIVGLGGIGRAVLKMVSGFGMAQPLFYDPLIHPDVFEQCGAKRVALDELLAQSDFVSLHCPLNSVTHNLIGPRELALMKPTAFLINTARGGLVNEDALHDALVSDRLAGAALDCFAHEPVTSPHRFGAFENVLLAPHSIAWTDELFRDIGQAACQGMIDLARGKQPRGVVNPEVFERPGFQRKWRRIRAGIAPDQWRHPPHRVSRAHA